MPPAQRLLLGLLAERQDHPARALVLLLLAADGECRHGRLPAAALLLSLAAAHRALAAPGAGLAATALAMARRNAALGEPACCAAGIATAIFALLQAPTTH